MNINNFFLIDKPFGITSFDVIRKLKKIQNTKKIGHTGTLDPLATGLLLVAVGNYTKLIPFFEKDKKTYEFKINLDGKTPSFDCETEINYITDEKQKYFKNTLTKDFIDNILQKNFSGKISQIPPKYSALKIGGKKALNMVRKGESFELKPREVFISKIKILSFNYPEIFLYAEVSSGTYIRSIASDLGEMLGTGGYITYLRRTKIGNLDLNLSQQLDNFDQNNYLDIQKLFPKNQIIDSLEIKNIQKLNNGLKIENQINLSAGIYFIKTGNIISNIIEAKDNLIIPLRKIC